MATLGKTAVGGTTEAQDPNFVEVFGPYTLSEDGTATKISIYGEFGGVTQAMTAVIYAKSGSAPAALVASSIPRAVPATAASWVDFTFTSNPSLPPADYFVGFHFGGASGLYTMYYDAVATKRYYQTQTYSDGVPNPFGTPAGNDNHEASAYITYTPAAATSTSQNLLLLGVG